MLLTSGLQKQASKRHSCISVRNQPRIRQENRPQNGHKTSKKKEQGHLFFLETY